MIPGNFPGDPFRSACVCGDFSIHRHGVFHGNERAFCGDIVEEHLVQRIAFLLQNIFGHIYQEGAELYSMGLHTFEELAREAGAIYKIRRVVLVNLEIFEEYLDTFRM